MVPRLRHIDMATSGERNLASFKRSTGRKPNSIIGRPTSSDDDPQSSSGNRNSGGSGSSDMITMGHVGGTLRQKEIDPTGKQDSIRPASSQATPSKAYLVPMADLATWYSKRILDTSHHLSMTSLRQRGRSCRLVRQSSNR